MITTVLFDWDGTLLNTPPAWLVAYKDTFKQFDIDALEDDIVRYVFGNVKGHEHYGITDVERFIRILKENARKNLNIVELYDGVKDVLDDLQQRGFKTAIVSSSPKAFLEQDLAKFGISQYFSLVIGQEDTHNHKPDPEPLLKALDLLGSKPDETVMVGDSDKDIFAARAAGVTPIFFYPQSNQLFYPKDLVDSWGADRVIAVLNEIRNHFE